MLKNGISALAFRAEAAKLLDSSNSRSSRPGSVHGPIEPVD
jgi:hypothetical protein